MVTLRDRIQAFINPTPNTRVEGGGTAPVMDDTPYMRFKVDRDRFSVVRDARTMYDGDPRVEKMHRDYI